MRLQPGEVCPESGEYNRVEQNGEIMGTATVEAGERMPPAQTRTQHYELA